MPSKSFLARLAADSAGNTLALIAASIAPILAMVGGGVDMGRGYLAQARLQQACDSGVLAARKRLGSEAVVTGDIPGDAGTIGNRFFNVNFRDGAYGSTERSFKMTLEEDFAISGVAKATMPTTIMQIFGFQEMPITVNCEAQINFNNTDVMMVLDVTGSMAQTNPGDSLSKMDTLKATVKQFYTQLNATAQAGTRIRYGFVPYSTNVNVGGLLKDEWVVDKWEYQSRELGTAITSVVQFTHWTAAVYVSGSSVTEKHSSYPASYSEMGGYHCPTQPANASNPTYTSTTKSETVTTPVPGTKITRTYVRTRNGVEYSVALVDKTCNVSKTTYSNYKDTYKQITEPALGAGSQWLYKKLSFDVGDWRTSGNGCIEERKTYKISDYDNVDLSKALDLDLDTVPDDDDSRWRPMYPQLIYARALKWDGSGAFDSKSVTTSDEFVAPYSLGSAACPPAALKLTTMTSDEIDAYLATLRPEGSTYHDIGMIWGGRLISPTGLFAAENADVSPSSPTSRHVIFLTDGETAPYDLSYSSYGLEPLDKRRWDAKSSLTLKQTVENRFAVACNEVKKRNVTVWVIGFGTELSDFLKDCAGKDHYFEADDAAELNASFGTIAKNLSRLRIQR